MRGAGRSTLGHAGVLNVADELQAAAACMLEWPGSRPVASPAKHLVFAKRSCRFAVRIPLRSGTPKPKLITAALKRELRLCRRKEEEPRVVPATK